MATSRTGHHIADQVAPALEALEVAAVSVAVFRAAPGLVSPVARVVGPLPIQSTATSSGRARRAPAQSAALSSVTICAPAKHATWKYGRIKSVERRPRI